jgi:hypothetical protein
MSAIVAAKDTPLRFGSPEEFHRVRAFFQSALFDEVNVCRALSVESLGDLGKINWEKIPLDTVSPQLRWCIQFFIRGLAVDQHESRAICGEEMIEGFCALGLLRPARKTPSAVVCPVWLYPCDGFVIASDRTNDPDGDPFQPGEDVVFPAIYPGTLRFLELLPEAQNGDALDLCGGSGIGALHLSRTARTVTTTDLAERSALFADFNGRLNRIPLESVCGDVYQPVDGRQFDLITAHPPFVPAVGPNMVYRDGGDTGEEVTRRIVAGLPAHLRAGGTCLILCVACDTQKATFEKRVKDWLGEQRDEFDIIYGCEKILSVDEVVKSLRRGQSSPNEIETQKLTERLRSLETRQFPYGALFIRRLSALEPREPLRLQLTLDGRAADFQRVLAWREQVRQPDFAAWLARSRPRLANQLELTIRHVLKDGELVPAQCTFTIDSGFQAALRPDGWIVPMVARLNGRKSVREIFEEAQSAGDLPPGFTLDAFADLVRQMTERGFLVPDAV